ncbi:PAS domain-containing protein [Oceanospirillum linum]|uniref:Aerotaxis receptor Aer n=1 Tax=Oceanospirillum linum TaxID=966 RepID=A0A1T1HCN6_OCELI|nr:PAS domain-containing protein [Oceanospirillum linum]OOV87621.1 aerotaxis receptor Aer [Oceanospirillum linum]SEF94088.1 PAS domain S-box-containing protein [Oleiphilus messinensis]SMP11984.1 PAS domain S-box-containing protein [Oceanospirillum linum]
MKPKSIKPTQIERKMRPEDFIVSKTDAKGRITYCNPIFLEFSGYTEQELLGVQHNIIRHPDMPRTAFKLAWDTIQSGKEFFAYVKNMSKDGSFYWVLAHMTPDMGNNGQPMGYTSVRRCPRPEALDAIIPIYEQLLSAEKGAGSRDALDAGFQVLDTLLKQEGKTYEELVLTI